MLSSVLKFALKFIRLIVSLHLFVFLWFIQFVLVAGALTYLLAGPVSRPPASVAGIVGLAALYTSYIGTKRILRWSDTNGVKLKEFILTKRKNGREQE